MLIKDVQPLTKVQCYGFSCIRDGEVRTVKQYSGELYIDCTHGKHFLEGQISDDGTEYVGLMKPEN